jgi:NTE family protein
MEKPKRKRVGLALGGGVVRGVAHLGVLTVLEQAGISIDYVSGTSAGSIIGATYCAGVGIETIKKYSMLLRWWHVARPVWPSDGLVSFDKLRVWLTDKIGDLDFTDLKIPFAVVATDLECGQPVRLDHGRLAPAVQASCAVPGLIRPVKIGGRLLGDGSLSDTVPVSVLRDMGADYVIGVDIFAPSIRRWLGPLGMGIAALEILIERAGGGIDQADCLIVPQLAGKTYFRFSKRNELYDLGINAAREKIPAIKIALDLD